MKKVVLLAVCAIIYVTDTNAQSLHLGGKLGANFTKIPGMDFKEGYNLGYQLGAFLELDINNNWGIQPELLYSQTNTEFSTEFKDAYENAGQYVNPLDDRKLKLNYLSIPVLLRLNAGKLLTFHVGPQFSILTSEDQNLLEEGRNAFKKGDVAAVFGAQVNLGSLRVYGRYNVGFTDLNDFHVTEPKWKQQQLQLGVGFKVL